jgi:perosamine synthetase
MKNIPKTKFNVPMSSPDITQAEKDAVMAVLETTSYSMGPEHLKFEKTIADYIGVKHAISVSSGTAGLHLCVRAAGISEGDMVITTPFSFMASSNVLLFENAIPIFVDVDPITGNIDPVLVKQAAEDIKSGGDSAKKWLPRKGTDNLGKLKAILPVDVFGQPYDYYSINEIAKQNDLLIIEDSCEALGAEYKGVKAGKLGDMATFAFYPNKQITTGEGGMIVTDNDDFAAYMRALRNQGRAPGDTWLEHSYLGYNYRLGEMSAAMGHVQMSRIEELLAKRAQVAKWYYEQLEGNNSVSLPSIVESTSKKSWFVFVVQLAPQFNRDDFINKMGNIGIPARPYFAPIHLQPFMVERFGYQKGDFPITEDLGNRGVALPFSGVMMEAQVTIVTESIKKILR